MSAHTVIPSTSHPTHNTAQSLLHRICVRIPSILRKTYEMSRKLTDQAFWGLFNGAIPTTIVFALQLAVGYYGFIGVSRRLDNIDARFNKMDARFDRMDAKFDRMGAKFDRMDTKFDTMEADMKSV